MLVLSRHRNEKIMIGTGIMIQVLDIRGDNVRLGIEAPPEIPVNREEIHRIIQAEKEAAPAAN